MAIDKLKYTEKIEPGLKADKTYIYFYLRFKKNNTQYYRTTNYVNTDYDKKTRLRKAREWANSERDAIENVTVFSAQATLNTIADEYFANKCEDTAWTKARQDNYDLYWCNSIGKKKVKDIRQAHIDRVKKQMMTKGHSKQTENGVSPRTIKKTLIQVLKPIMEYAKTNKLIDEVPTFDVPKQTRQKKIVDDAGSKLATLYTTITSIYKEEPFYRALFLFALYGRRWNEIRTLEWSDINYLNNTYTIRAINNKIGRDQTYELSVPIAEALSHIKDDTKGLVFKSPTTGKELYPPKRQLAKVREASDIPELTMHYFRHILVSAMGEMGTATTVLSASLGHTNLDTVNNFYLSANHTKASKEANLMISSITNE